MGRKATQRQEKTKNAHAVALGALGGVKGGPARAKKLTLAQRVRIARMGGEARAKSLVAAEKKAVSKIARTAKKK